MNTLCTHCVTLLRRFLVRYSTLLLLAVCLTGSAFAQKHQNGNANLENGQIVLIRHAYAPGGGDPDNFTLGQCHTQRNLNETGRQQARQIGQWFRNQPVAVTHVLSSQWCRSIDTATLAFPDQVIEASEFNSFFRNRQAEPDHTQRALTRFSQWQGPGVMVVITHQVNITALTNIVPRSGEGIVIEYENGAVKVVERLNFGFQ